MKQQKTRILTLLLSALLLCTLVVTTMPTQAAAVTQTTNTSAATTKQLATPTLKSVSGSNNGVTVTWGKVSGAAKYRVFRKTGYGNWQRVGDTTALTYTDTTAQVGTQYVYTVRCITSDGKVYTSSYNNTGLTITYTAAPKLTTVETNTSGITVTWGKVSGAAKYSVFRKTSYGDWRCVGNTTALTYTDTTAQAGTQYVYTVRCVTSDGKAYTGGYMTAGINATRLATPTLTGAKGDKSSVTVTWNKVSGAAKYRVFRKTAGGSWQWLGDTTALTYTDTTAQVGTQYVYTVRCITSDGKVYTSGHSIAGITGQCAHTHTWDSGTETTAATCEEDGVQTYTCTVCGQTKTESIPALGHNWMSDGTKTITVIDKAAWDEEVIIIDKAEWDETVTVTDKAAYDEVITVVDKEAWDEEEQVCYLVCKDCGHEELSDGNATTKMIKHIGANLDSHPKGGYTTKYRYETVHHDAETHTETIHHDAVTHTETVHHDAETHTETIHHDAVTHTETVSTGYTCTRCGEHKD